MSPQVSKTISKVLCPLCSKPAQALCHPFCSKRCQMIDLGHWLKETYVIPAQETFNSPLYEENEEDKE